MPCLEQYTFLAFGQKLINSFARSTAQSTTPDLSLASMNLRYNLREVITKSLLFFEAQRSGLLPPNNRISWRSHSALRDGLDRGVDLSGGYYIGEFHLSNARTHQ